MNLFRRKNLSHIIWMVIPCLFLSGCAGNAPLPGNTPLPGNAPFFGKNQEKEESAFEGETLGLTPDFSYERKAERPNIQVNRQGYLPGSTKIAIFREKELPESFQVMKKDSGECVYEGKVSRRESMEDGTLVGYGNFTSLEEEGDYYIRTDEIGCSYYFAIGKDAYLETALEYAGIIEEKSPAETVELCETISYLLTAYEMYPGLILQIWKSNTAGSEEEGTGGDRFFQMLREETDLLLSLQDERTGGIYGETSASPGEAQETEQKISGEATAAFAGTMAKYSYLYQQYDWDYANTCLKAAAKAWRYSDSPQGQPEEKEGADGKFYAAAELYRASNEIIYHNYILQNRELLLNQEEDFYLLMAKITYLSTRRNVDHDLCGELMEALMREAEQIAEVSKSGIYLVENEKTDVILWEMTRIALANYAIMNYEYVTVIENHVHYLMGRNEKAEILPPNPGSSEAAQMLFLLSVVEEERKIIENSNVDVEEE